MNPYEPRPVLRLVLWSLLVLLPVGLIGRSVVSLVGDSGPGYDGSVGGLFRGFAADLREAGIPGAVLAGLALVALAAFAPTAAGAVRGRVPLPALGRSARLLRLAAAAVTAGGFAVAVLAPHPRGYAGVSLPFGPLRIGLALGGLLLAVATIALLLAETRSPPRS